MRRYAQRIRQHADYVNELLREDKFKFTADDHILLDRRHAPYPKKPRTRPCNALAGTVALRVFAMGKNSAVKFSPTNSDVILPLTKSATDEIAATLTRHYRWNLRMVTNWGQHLTYCRPISTPWRTHTIRIRIISTPNTRRIFPSA